MLSQRGLQARRVEAKLKQVQYTSKEIQTVKWVAGLSLKLLYSSLLLSAHCVFLAINPFCVPHNYWSERLFLHNRSWQIKSSIEWILSCDFRMRLTPNPSSFRLRFLPQWPIGLQLLSGKAHYRECYADTCLKISKYNLFISTSQLCTYWFTLSCNFKDHFLKDEFIHNHPRASPSKNARSDTFKNPDIKACGELKLNLKCCT